MKEYVLNFSFLIILFTIIHYIIYVLNIFKPIGSNPSYLHIGSYFKHDFVNCSITAYLNTYLSLNLKAFFDIMSKSTKRFHGIYKLANFHLIT